jgi:AAA+ ATPase superfamily predicted ATPase
MKFINRKEELARLNRLVRQPMAGVAVIWGRRRMGKTRLLLEWVNRHGGVYYMADESSAAIQRKYFAAAIEQSLPGFSEIEYPDWTTLLSRLAKEAGRTKWRGPIVIDELPYLISTSPELPSILQGFVDRDAKKAKLIIAFCGSSQRMMQGAILDSAAPLYGRADELMKLKPISVGYMKEALKIKKPRQIVESYAIWGGIPRYWELVEKNKGSFFEQIDRLVLDPMGPLNEEPQRLLLEESPSAIGLRPILDAIGLGAHRLSEVAARIAQPTTSMMRPIQRLIELDLIQKEIPYGTDESNSKRTLYKIKDPFVRFWFEIVAPRRSLFFQAEKSTRIQWLKESIPQIYSIMWEELCRLAAPHLSRDWSGSTFEPASRFWQGQGLEWDILTQSQNGSKFLIGEAKWTAKIPSVTWIHRTIKELKDKGLPPVHRQPNAKILYALFIPEKPKKLILPADTKVIDARDVLRALK